MRGAFGKPYGTAARVDIGQARGSWFGSTTAGGGARGKKHHWEISGLRIFGEENWDSMGCFGDFSRISGGKELIFGYLEDTRICS